MSENNEFTIEAFERAIQSLEKQNYVLRLYVTGQTPRSVMAIERLKGFCEKHLKGHYELEVIDIYQQSDTVEGDQILAVPTLIKKFPLPLRRLVGDMSNEEKILIGLDINDR